MRKLSILIALVVCFQTNAQVVEGTVKYTMQFEGMPQSRTNPLTSSIMTISFKKGVALAEMKTPAYTMRTVTDVKKGVLVLMDGVGQKFFMRKTSEELARDKALKKTSDPVIVVSKEKKKILGYECTKILVTNYAGGKNVVIWQTDKIHGSTDIGIVNAEMLNKLKGFPLEVDAEQGAIKTKMIATELSTKPVPDAVFNLSTAGYTERKAGAPVKNPAK